MSIPQSESIISRQDVTLAETLKGDLNESSRHVVNSRHAVIAVTGRSVMLFSDDVYASNSYNHATAGESPLPANFTLSGLPEA